MWGRTWAICSTISAVERFGGSRGFSPLSKHPQTPQISEKLERGHPLRHFGLGTTHSLLPSLLLKVIRIWINEVFHCISEPILTNTALLQKYNVLNEEITQTQGCFCHSVCFCYKVCNALLLGCFLYLCLNEWQHTVTTAEPFGWGEKTNKHTLLWHTTGFFISFSLRKGGLLQEWGQWDQLETNQEWTLPSFGRNTTCLPWASESQSACSIRMRLAEFVIQLRSGAMEPIRWAQRWK